MTKNDDEGFNIGRAELFEAMGHPNRIRILKALSDRPLGFSELKRTLSMESSGLLSFHLQKLANLVKTTSEGAYALTDEGKEALRIAETLRNGSSEDGGKWLTRPLKRERVIIAGLLIGIILMGSVAAYQQQEIATLNQAISNGTIDIGGVRYWYASYPTYLANGTSLTFHGVTFTYLQPQLTSYTDPRDYIFQGSVRLSNGTLLDLTGKTVQIQMSVGVIPGSTVTNATAGHYSSSVAFNAMRIRFQDGTKEVYNKFSINASYIFGDLSIPRPHFLLNFAYHPPLVNPWFTQHLNPSAGLFWDYTNNVLRFYVSTS